MGKAGVVVGVAGVLGTAAAAIAAVLASRQRSGSRSLRRNSSISWYQQLPIYKLRNSNGMEVSFSPIGAAILKLVVPDKNGRKADVVLGHEDIATYITGDPCPYFGVVVGRVANRIANAKFTLDGIEYKLYANNGANSLHGGALGLHKRKWDARQYDTETHTAIEFQYNSPVGEEGYPGQLNIRVTYLLNKHQNELSTLIHADTDEPTPVNIAQHSYFNLSGHDKGTVLDHIVRIHADHYTPVKADSIPTGEIKPVAGTPFDFTTPHGIGERIADVPGAAPGGYDHNYVLFGMGAQAKFITKNGMASDRPKLAATVVDPASGRAMDALTTAPGMQFYTGNYLDGIVGKGGVKYAKHAGFCMETQGFPDAVNQPAFPSVIIKPQEPYRHEIVYRFYTA